MAGDAARARRVERRLSVVLLNRWDGTAATATGRGRGLSGPGEGPPVLGVDGAAAAAGRERLHRLGEKPAAATGQEWLRGLEEGPSAAAVSAVRVARDGVVETGFNQMPVTYV